MSVQAPAGSFHLSRADGFDKIVFENSPRRQRQRFGGVQQLLTGTIYNYSPRHAAVSVYFIHVYGTHNIHINVPYRYVYVRVETRKTTAVAAARVQ